ncbi:SAM-dependent methyltransferase [Acidothermaceae bacterium B102]|nr:SAM-dependent methyltransferase [Acidothermaceae bacterium B102]
MDEGPGPARTVAAVTLLTPQPWRQAMDTALYGPDGFYRRPAGPAAHFRTSVSASPLFASALLRLALEVYDELGRPAPFTVVDVGAGRGELLTQLSELVPDDFDLVGVDLVERPPGLPESIRWYQGLDQLTPVTYGLLVANEWLDNIPLDVVEDGRLVEVDEHGTERLGSAAPPDLLAWIDRYAAGATRVDVGLTRDVAWAAATAKLTTGVALAIDYASDESLSPQVDRSSTLTGYRNGRQVPPVPDGSCDLTAHVMLTSCAEAAEVEPGDSLVLTQRKALRALGVTGARPPLELATLDPAGYLQALSAASAGAELIAPHGLGDFGWLVQARGTDLPVTLLDAEDPRPIPTRPTHPAPDESGRLG